MKNSCNEIVAQLPPPSTSSVAVLFDALLTVFPSEAIDDPLNVEVTYLESLNFTVVKIILHPDRNNMVTC